MTLSHATHRDLTIEGDAGWFKHHQPAIDDGNVDFAYGGSSGETTVTLRGLAGNTRVGFVDADSQQVLGYGETSSNGVVTFTLPNSQHRVEIQTSKGAPQLSQPSPTGDLSLPPDALSIRINDSDYPEESHTIEFYLDGKQVGTAQANQNKTVSTSINPDTLAGGDHQWHVEVEDAYGQVAQKGYSFSVPDELVVRNESSPDSLVDNTTVTVRFFGSDTVVKRQTSNGSISLGGLPVNEKIIVTAEADGYYSRTTVLESLYRQQSVYLLPDTNQTDTVEVRFVLEDTTGEFPTDSTLYVERALTQNNSTSYQTVVSDEFGAQGVTTRLKQGERYQLRIKSPSGETAVLGAYTADVAETVTLRPDTASVDLSGDDQTIGYDAYKENDAIQIEYSDPTNATDYLTIRVYEQYNESNVLRPAQTYYDLGNLSLSEPLTNATRNTTWVVEFSGERNGKQIEGELVVGEGPRNLVPGELSGVWRVTVGVFVLLVSALIFSQLNIAAGTLTTALTGGILWWIGLLDGVTTGASVVLSIGIAIVYSAIQR